VTGVKKDTIQKLITAGIAIIVVAGIVIARVSGDKSDAALRQEILAASHDNMVTTSQELSYEEYLASYESVGVTEGIEISLEGADYSASESCDITDLSDGNILTGDEGSITYEFNVDVAGF
jgi:hypothetical protein